MNPYERKTMFEFTDDARIDRATELAVEQRERFESFKKYYRNPDSNTDQITAFLSQPFEAQHAFLIADHLYRVHQRKSEEKNTPSK